MRNSHLSDRCFGSVIEDYNVVLNSLEMEYGAFFTDEDIEEIKERNEEFWQDERDAIHQGTYIKKIKTKF